uniref:acylphosphatase-2 isoform X3 n=1 Tax=Podarcis muralis TaxID=64176 RepID=UPI00109FE4E3|nr:acylphosphatase-2 isoform X3 [Podarcis muralis]
MSRVLKSVDYEVFGRVQGVCFRMYTEDKARKMGVVGWVKNTRQGTVTGQVQGPEDKVQEICFQLSKAQETGIFGQPAHVSWPQAKDGVQGGVGAC